MAKTIIISFINLFILQAIEGAVTTRLSFMKAYNHPRLKPVLPIKQCMLNQYYDNDEGRCLIIPGGGYTVSIDSDGRCEKEIIRSDLVNKRRYTICRPSKIIYAECKNHQIFSSRLKRCVSNFSLSETIRTPLHQHRRRYHQNLPVCRESGKFPAPSSGERQIFYTCTSNGFRLYRNIYSCPHNTFYNPHTQMCINGNSYSTTYGFSTTEFPIKLVTIIPKTTTTTGNSRENLSEDLIIEDVLISEDKIQTAIPIISKNEEAGGQHFHQTYISSTTDQMPNLDFKSYKQNDAAVINFFEIFYTENILAKTTPATPLDTENVSNRMKTSIERVVHQFYTVENRHTTTSTLEPLFFTSVMTEFPEIIQEKTSNVQEEGSIILIKNDDNFRNTEIDDITEIFTKSTTTEEVSVTKKPFSPSDNVNTDNGTNYSEQRNISSSSTTTPETLN